MLRVHFDGSCQPINPYGVPCYGFVIYRIGSDGKAGSAIKVGRGVAGKPWSIDATNNLAEYVGLLKALEWIVENEEDHEIEILGDSELVIKQLNGEYKVEAPHLVALHSQCMNLLRRFDWKARSIPREENEIADAQSKRAYEEYSAGRSSES